MTVLCKPAGRGNWAVLTLQLKGSRAQPLLVKAGDRFELAGVTWRVCEVRA